MEDIAAAAGECRDQKENRNGADVDDESEGPGSGSGSNSRRRTDRNGNAEDCVIASKRRRRIEIPRIPVKKAIAAEEPTITPDLTTTTSATRGTGEISMAKEYLYLNSFCAGPVEFVGHQGSDEDTDGGQQSQQKNGLNCGGDASPPINCSSSGRRNDKNGTRGLQVSAEENHDQQQESREDGGQVQRVEIKSIADLVGGKMKFLSEGRPAVSGVQAMAIQLEVCWDWRRRQIGKCCLFNGTL